MSRFSQTKFRNFVAHSYGFTLAEVLITLSILGVIAAITVPSIIRNFQDRAQITGVKRAYALLDNALQQAVAINGPLNTWNWPIPDNSHPSWVDQSNTDFFAQQLASQLNLKKYCGSWNGACNNGNCGCFWYGWLNGRPCNSINCWQAFFKTLKGKSDVYMTGTEGNIYGKMWLKNNMRISVNINYPKSDGQIGYIKVDINGEKGPNRYGYDVFFFGVDAKKGLTSYGANDKNNCSMQSDITNSGDGQSCSTWILKHNNMNYKYKDVRSQW